MSDFLIILLKKVAYTSFNMLFLVAGLALWCRFCGNRHPRAWFVAWSVIVIRFVYDMLIYHPSATIQPFVRDHGLLKVGLEFGVQPVSLLTAELALNGTGLWSVGDLLCGCLGPWPSMLLALSLAFFTAWGLLRALAHWIGFEGWIRARGCTMVRRGGTRLCLCDGLSTPLVFGFLKPAIALPRRLCSIFSPEELEVVLRHEEAHLRRKDHLLFPLLALLRRAFPYILPLRFACSSLTAWAEKLCDLEAAPSREQRLHLARALVKLAEFQQHVPGGGLRACHAPLLSTETMVRDRLAHLRTAPIATPDATPGTSRRWLAAILLLVFILGCRLFA